MKRICVIGGGASGFFAAISAGEHSPTDEIIMVEKTSKVLSKVKVPGGGRCNVTNGNQAISAFLKGYPRGAKFLKKSFHHFSSKDTVEWFEKKGVTLKIEPDGRMFPTTDNSQTIIDCLTKAFQQAGGKLITNQPVKALAQKDKRWEVTFANDDQEVFDAIIIAVGGTPKAEGLKWLESLGIETISPVPSLFTFNVPQSPLKQLQGITIEKVSIKITGTKLAAEGPLLITHWGVSGPAVLKLSAWGARSLHDTSYQFRFSVNWMPDLSEEKLRIMLQDKRAVSSQQKIKNKNPLGLPNRFWLYCLKEIGIREEDLWENVSKKEINKLVALLCNSTYEAKGKTTFKEEFVTCGGIALSEIDPNTMETKKHRKLYFAGEILDIDGITGGYNFQAAWTTGFLAGRNAVKDEIKQNESKNEHQ